MQHLLTILIDFAKLLGLVLAGVIVSSILAILITMDRISGLTFGVYIGVFIGILGFNFITFKKKIAKVIIVTLIECLLVVAIYVLLISWANLSINPFLISTVSISLPTLIITTILKSKNEFLKP